MAKPTSAKVTLLLGGNMGDRTANLQQAVSLIESKAGKVLSKSSIYETAAWGKTEQPSFLNQAICIESNHSPQALLKILLDIEKELGRVREEKWGQRTMDIDILYYADQILTTTELKVPHPGITERRFVLVPLCEIAPDFVHPVYNVSNSALLAQCADTLAVQKHQNAH